MSLITISEGIGCGGLAIGQDFRPEDLKGLGEKGGIHTSGFANTAEARERMIEVARGVPGVPDVNSEGELIPGGSA